MMFKKKQVLPARPKPPTVENIENDIKDADDSDVIFTYFANEIHTSPVEMPVGDEGHLGNRLAINDEMNPDRVYEKVKTFVDQNIKINNLLQTLESLCTDLQNAGYELETQMSEVMQHLKPSDKK